MNSHKYATKLRDLANFLESKEAFEVEDTNGPYIFFRMSSRKGFEKAIKSLGYSEIKSGTYNISLDVDSPSGTTVTITCDKAVAGERVQTEEWHFPMLKNERH